MPEPLRVLIVIKSLGPGGAERLVVDQLAHADPELFAYELFVCTPREPNLLGEARSLHVPVHLGYESALPWPLVLARLLRRSRPDVVHAHLPVAAVGARLASLACAPRRPHLVYTEHNRWPSYRPLTRWANRATIALDHLDLAVSADAAASMEWPAPTPVVIDHGVTLSPTKSHIEAREALLAELGLPLTTVLVGTVANFRREKDQGTLLRAFADDRLADSALVLVGQGPLEADLRATADRLGIADRVHFLGYRPDAVQVMAGFDVFTLPSAHEGRPIALMEAMTLGRPVVVTSAGGMVDMVDDGTTGIVVPPGDSAALADALAALVQSPAARGTMSAHVRTAAAAFDGSAAFDRIEAEYLRLAERR